MGSAKYPQLNDERWLRQKYLEEGLTPHAIAKAHDISSSVLVTRALSGFGIPQRNRREGFVLHQDPDHFHIDASVLTGCLLGDAGLGVQGKVDSATPRFTKSNKNRDHVEFVASLLFSQNYEERISDRSYFNKAIGRVHTMYELRSLTHDELRPWYDLWYPENSGRIKVIPEEVVIDPTVLLHWFLDDGTTSWRVNKGENSVRLRFCTQSFSRSDQDRFCDQINEKFGLSARTIPAEKGSGREISIPSTRVNLFFDIIGPPPVESLGYKWKQGPLISGELPPVGGTRYPLLKDPEWLYRKSVMGGMTSIEIADEVGCSKYYVRQYLQRYRKGEWLERDFERG